MKRVWLDVRAGLLPAVLVVLVCSCFGAPGGSMPADTQATTTLPSSAPTALQVELDSGALKAKADRLEAAGIEAAMAGQFAEARTTLRRAAELAPEAGSAGKAAALLDDYLVRHAEDEKQRAEEYARMVQRVERNMLAQEYMPTLAKAGVEEKLRKKVKEIVSALDEIEKAVAMETAGADEAAKMKAGALSALSGSDSPLRAAEAMLSGDQSPYAVAFREVVETLSGCLGRYAAVWGAVDATTKEGRLVGARKLLEIETGFEEAAGDLEVMISEAPWMAGLAQAQLALEVAPDPEQVRQQRWYRDLVSADESIARQAVDERGPRRFS